MSYAISDYALPPEFFEKETCTRCNQESKELRYYDDLLLCPYDYEQELLRSSPTSPLGEGLREAV